MRRIINADGVEMKHFSIKELTTPRNPDNVTNMKLLSEYIAGLTIEFEVRKIKARPDTKKGEWEDKANHYEIMFWSRARSFKTFFSTGSGWKKAPTITDVLPCLLSDAQAHGQTFEEWCGDFGMSSDSIAHLKTYEACLASYAGLVKVFGVDILQEMWDCENDI